MQWRCCREALVRSCVTRSDLPQCRAATFFISRPARVKIPIKKREGKKIRKPLCTPHNRWCCIRVSSIGPLMPRHAPLGRVHALFGEKFRPRGARYWLGGLQHLRPYSCPRGVASLTGMEGLFRGSLGLNYGNIAPRGLRGGKFFCFCRKKRKKFPVFLGKFLQREEPRLPGKERDFRFWGKWSRTAFYRWFFIYFLFLFDSEPKTDGILRLVVRETGELSPRSCSIRVFERKRKSNSLPHWILQQKKRLVQSRLLRFTYIETLKAIFWRDKLCYLLQNYLWDGLSFVSFSTAMLFYLHETNKQIFLCRRIK